MNEFVFVAYWLTRNTDPELRVALQGVYPDMDTAKRHCETELGQGPPTLVSMQWEVLSEDGGQPVKVMSHYPNGPVIIEKHTFTRREDLAIPLPMVSNAT